MDKIDRTILSFYLDTVENAFGNIGLLSKILRIASAMRLRVLVNLLETSHQYYSDHLHRNCKGYLYQ